MADSEKSSTLPMNKSSSLKATIQGLKKKAFSSSTLSIAELSDAETSRIPDDTVRCDQDTPDTGLEEEDGPRVGGDVKNEHISLGEGCGYILSGGVTMGGRVRDFK